MRRCRKCGELIRFKKLDNGKWKPTNPDGSDHWDKCKERQWKEMSESEREAIMAKHPPVMTGVHNLIVPDDSLPWYTDTLEELFFVKL